MVPPYHPGPDIKDSKTCRSPDGLPLFRLGSAPFVVRKNRIIVLRRALIDTI